jgi:hypothetical protein
MRRTCVLNGAISAPRDFTNKKQPTLLPMTAYPPTSQQLHHLNVMTLLLHQLALLTAKATDICLCHMHGSRQQVA